MRVITMLAAAALLAGGCGGEQVPSVGGAVDGEVLDEARWRVVSDGPGGPSAHHFEDVTAAVEPDDLAEQWEAYGAEGSPDVLEDGEVAIFVGFGESGSCPEEIREVRVDAEDGEVAIERGPEGGPQQACTDDFNPRTIVLAVDGQALPDGPFLLASAGSQRTFWHGVAPRGADQPPAVHPDQGLGYGQDEPVARLDAEPERAAVGDEIELVVTAGDHEAGVDDGSSPPEDPIERADMEAADEEWGDVDAADRLAPATLERWTGYRWEPLLEGPDPAHGHPAVERVVMGSLGPGEQGTTAVVDTSGLEPAWYEVTVEVLGLGDRGRGEVSAHFEVTE